MSILESIETLDDFKNLPANKLDILCQEIREKLINDVSKTGGHLASNLGIVELMVAIDRVYDPYKDKIVFDVGHQCYTHKILTGRKNEFKKLRQYGGLSGFPKPSESEADAFIAGHASNSISVALGMAAAISLQKLDKKVVAIIGDGALTGGLAYEGLSNAGGRKLPLVVVLNDNNMSISSNVGGVAKNLSKLRTSKAYSSFKNAYNSMFKNSKNQRFKEAVHTLKEGMKHNLFNNIFTDLGFDYIGPIDGHNIRDIEAALHYAIKANRPVLVHAVTKKGKGYKPAEESPNLFHGIGKFDVDSGLPNDNGKESYATHFGNTLLKLAKEDKNIVALTAAMSDGTGLSEFAQQLPKRFYDVGIAEGHAICQAAGMASIGMKPVFCVYSSFLQRSYDMLIHDIALQNLHVVIGVDHAGIVGNDGETHNGTFDISYLRSVPNMTILSPSNFAEMDEMLKIALYQIDGPVAIRYPKGSEKNYKDVTYGATEVVCEGEDVTIVSYGDLINEALCAADKLKKENINAEVVKINCLSPLNVEVVEQSLRKSKHLVVVEDCCNNGCIGEAIEASVKKSIRYSSLLLNCGSGIVKQGNVDQLYKEYNLDSDGIVENVKKLIK